MFPNPQDALPLPPRPSLDQYKKRAKDLIKACESGEPDAIAVWAATWIETLAKLRGEKRRRRFRAGMKRSIEQVADFARTKLAGSACTLANAQFVIARSHGFESWPKFAKHVNALSQPDSPIAQFEAAADAIVAGDAVSLKRLLRENPGLIRARSARQHRATLLHYVAANGVENFRQNTPKNATKIAEILLQAGAGVNDQADVYGGGATPLGLTATSIHPERAGVQQALMQVLLDHGASIDTPQSAGNEHPTVQGCLANGRAQAAEFLAERGARLNLEAAAGVGRLDIVRSFFNEDGSLKKTASKAEMEAGFGWACLYGRLPVVEFLLAQGVDLSAQSHGQTGLHWAVVGRQVDVTKLLIARGAPLEEKNTYGGTVLGQALWSAVNAEDNVDYVPIIKALVTAGANIEPGTLSWLAQQDGASSRMKARVAALLRRHGAKS